VSAKKERGLRERAMTKVNRGHLDFMLTGSFRVDDESICE